MECRSAAGFVPHPRSHLPLLCACLGCCRDVAGSMAGNATVIPIVEVPHGLRTNAVPAVLQQWQDATNQLYMQRQAASQRLLGAVTVAHLQQQQYMQLFWAAVCRQRPCLCSQLQAADGVELLAEVRQGGAVVKVESARLLADLQASQASVSQA